MFYYHVQNIPPTGPSFIRMYHSTSLLHICGIFISALSYNKTVFYKNIRSNISIILSLKCPLKVYYVYLGTEGRNVGFAKKLFL
jgi:hypothetical protein